MSHLQMYCTIKKEPGGGVPTCQTYICIAQFIKKKRVVGARRVEMLHLKCIEQLKQKRKRAGETG